MPYDQFKQSKGSHLDKLGHTDKSKKGEVDELVKPLIKLINSDDNYFTTSSCSGRIMILIPSKIKQDVKWLFFSHEPVETSDLISKIHNLVDKSKEELWFKLEGFILHVACRDIESAQRLLNIAKDSGLKRSGIISTTAKVMVEIISSELLETPISKNNNLMVEDNYLEFIIDEANAKLRRTHNRIKKLELMLNKKIIGTANRK
jgi:tRNA wybutosine-synthesizing protein 3